MQDSYVAFIKDGTAGLEKLSWPAYTGVPNGTVRHFGDGVAAKNGNTRDYETLCDPSYQPSSYQL